MVSNNDQNHQTTIPQTNPEIPIFLPAIAYFYLIFNSVSTIYQAYTHGDFSLAVFIVFVYVGYFSLMYCLTQFQALPPQENSPRKDLLKSVIWVLTSFILFGFAYQFYTFIHPVAAIFVFAIAISVSSFLFFLYFFHDGHQQQPKKPSDGSCCRLRIRVLRNSSPSSNVMSESKMREVVPGPENV
ncbi:uncharacterized protein LOC111292631 [Durio zibethinus]|uniref:Uncharacterized protein LOC111292631 n=1 Tax=Durio zibethinus TaxID=66656 RepID=A0A6P5YKM2_DURZI|nr:uncharacterized protein LOC111292631 [Durio zibethinus]